MDFEKRLSEHRRYFHKNAEAGFDNPKTAGYILSVLGALGITPKKCGKSGIIADIGKGETDELILLRADTDALNIKEKTGLGFACKSGRMHACGHDMHAAMLLGAAELLCSYDIKGRVRLMFQPAEEILAGAKDMIEDGVLEGVTRAMMIHVITATELETGTILLPTAQVRIPSADFFKITLTGYSAHGAMADKSINPISAAAAIVPALERICSQKLPAGSKAALSIGRVEAAGAANVIADKAIIEGSFRAHSKEHSELIRKSVSDICKGISQAYGTKQKLSIGAGCPLLINDEKAIMRAKAALEQLTDIPTSSIAQTGSSGSEDFAFISEKVPSVMLILAAGNTKDGYVYPQHHPKADFDESVLRTGALAYTAFGIFENI